MKSDFLLSGYFGFGNTGDEAVLAAAIQLLRQHRPNPVIRVLSANPSETQRSLAVAATARMSPAALEAVRNTRVFLSGGGSLLQDQTSLKSLLYYLALLRWARHCGAKTMIFAQGMGPLRRPAARRWVARELSQVTAITVRDAESAELLEEIGVHRHGKSPVEVTADLVFALAPRVTDRVTQCAPSQPSISVSLRPWPGVEALLVPLAEVLAEQALEYSLVLWPMQPSADLPICRRLAERLPGARVLEEPLEPAEWSTLAGWTSLVIGMRLHALILAASRGQPVAGLSYDPKVDALLGRVRAPLLGRTGQAPDVDRMRATLLELLDSGEEQRRSRVARSEHLRAKAVQNAERAVQLLD